MNALNEQDRQLIVVALKLFDDEVFKDSLANVRDADVLRSLQRRAREARHLAQRLEAVKTIAVE